jgi:hypothetical protein
MGWTARIFGWAVGPNPKFSRILNRQGAKNAKSEMAYWGEKNETSEGPRNRFSRSSMEGSEHRILGDLGVMAVQGFSRIRVGFGRDRSVQRRKKKVLTKGKRVGSIRPRL